MPATKRDILSKRVMEKICSDVEEIEMNGMTVIEVMLSEKHGDAVTHFGFDGFKIVKRGGFGYDAKMGVSVRRDCGVSFQPDAKGRCWGWLLDTERNRKTLAGHLKHGTFIFVDNKTKHEIEDLALELGLPTKKMLVATQDREINKLLLKKKAVNPAENEEIEMLRQQLNEANKKLALKGEMTSYAKDARPVPKGLQYAVRHKAQLTAKSEKAAAQNALKKQRETEQPVDIEKLGE